MTIKHLVLSGGGPAGLVQYGAVIELKRRGVWSVGELESVYACSVGAIIGVIAMLDYEPEWTDDYLIKRPWNEALAADPSRILGALDDKGVYGTEFVETLLGPLLEAKGIDKKVTLGEFTEATGVKLVVVTVDINAEQLAPTLISSSSDPELGLIEAVAMSSAYPILMKPVERDGACYVDGGLIANFPLDLCFEHEECEEEEVLGFNILSRGDNMMVDPDSGLMSLMRTMVWKVYKFIDTSRRQSHNKYVVPCKSIGAANMESWLDPLQSANARSGLIESGCSQARKWVRSTDLLQRSGEESVESV